MDTCYNMNKPQKQHARVHTRPWRTQMTVLGKSIASCGKGLLFPPQACQYGCLQKCRDLRAVVGVIFSTGGASDLVYRGKYMAVRFWAIPVLGTASAGTAHIPLSRFLSWAFLSSPDFAGCDLFCFVLLCFPWNLVSCYVTAASCVVNLVSAHTQAGFHFNSTAACWQKRPERCKAGLGSRQGRMRRPAATGINYQAASSSFWSNIEVPK